MCIRNGYKKCPAVKVSPMSCFDLKDDLREPFSSNLHYQVIEAESSPDQVWAAAGLDEVSADSRVALFLSWIPKDSDNVAFGRIVESFLGTDLILVGDQAACGGLALSASMAKAGFSDDRIVFEEALPNFLGWRDCIRVFRRR